MRIQNNLPTNPYNSRQKAKTPNSPSFLGPRLPQQSFDKLDAWVQKKKLCRNIPDLLLPQYFIGGGRESKVYRLNEHPFFLLKVAHDAEYNINYTNHVMPLPDTFPSYNFGQAIAILQNNYGKYIQVILKQEGPPNGIKDWLTTLRLNVFPRQYVPEFISQLKKVANMPPKAYDLLTEEVKIITDKVPAPDFYNPQNILVDERKQVFNLVDIKINEGSYKHYLQFIPSCLLYSLIDEMNFFKVLNSANMEQQQEILTYARIIKLKIQQAAKNNSLNNDEIAFENVLYPSSCAERHQKAKSLLGKFSF